MTTASDFTAAARAIGRIAVDVKPDDSDPYATERRLIQYHLNVAAGRTRAIAEALEKQEHPA